MRCFCGVHEYADTEPAANQLARTDTEHTNRRPDATDDTTADAAPDLSTGASNHLRRSRYQPPPPSAIPGFKPTKKKNHTFPVYVQLRTRLLRREVAVAFYLLDVCPQHTSKKLASIILKSGDVYGCG